MTKRLIFISGTMGVGKTTVSKLLFTELNNSVFLDGDWCWSINPFIVNEENKIMVIENICFLINSFIKNTTLQNIIFCWVMNKQEIIDEIRNRLIGEYNFYHFTLLTDTDFLKSHLEKDTKNGLRENYDIEQAVEYMEQYKKINSVKIDNVENDIYATVGKIKDYLK